MSLRHPNDCGYSTGLIKCLLFLFSIPIFYFHWKLYNYCMISSVLLKPIQDYEIFYFYSAEESKVTKHQAQNFFLSSKKFFLVNSPMINFFPLMNYSIPVY